MRYLLFASMAIMFMASCVFAGNYPAEAYGEVAEAISLWHVFVRTPALAAIKNRYQISDDDFSSILVSLAEKLKNSEQTEVRGFALGALIDFGTTNALEYLRNEALHGPSQSNGLEIYGIITGFDSRCYDLAREVFSSTDPDVTFRKGIFCDTLYGVICSDGEYDGRKLSPNARDLAMEYLYVSASETNSISIYIDNFLVKYDTTYPKSQKRKRNIENLATAFPTNTYHYNYFQAELAKIIKAEQEAERKTAAEAIGETEPQAESNLWLYSLVALAASLALAAFLALCKKQKRSS